MYIEIFVHRHRAEFSLKESVRTQCDQWKTLFDSVDRYYSLRNELMGTGGTVYAAQYPVLPDRNR